MDQNTDRKGDRQRERTEIHSERETDRGNGLKYRQKERKADGMDQNVDKRETEGLDQKGGQRDWTRKGDRGIGPERQTEGLDQKGRQREWKKKNRQNRRQTDGMNQNTDRKGDRRMEWTRIQTEQETDGWNGPEYRQNRRQTDGMYQNTNRKGDRGNGPE